jgi:hypothetical protein
MRVRSILIIFLFLFIPFFSQPLIKLYKVFTFMRGLFLLLLCLIPFKQKLNAQHDKALFSVRVSAQSDFQKARFKEIHFPYDFREHKANQINWGLDFLSRKKISNRSNVYFGIGYFRNKFNFKRAYDHQFLNRGRDSFPIGTNTYDYTFHLLRIPIGLSFLILEKNKYDFRLAIEQTVNFSFQQIYNGQLPFPNANNKYSKFKYYGNSILIFLPISKHFSRNTQVGIEPYIRLFNIYQRKDLILFENESKPYSRLFDGIGVALKYSTIF